MPARKFTPPWTARPTAGSFVVEDAEGRALAYVYFGEAFTGTGGDKLTRDEARRIAANIAKLPVWLKAGGERRG